MHELKHPDTIIFTKNKYYNRDITEDMIYRYYSSVASKIIEELGKDKIMNVIRVDGDIIKKKFDNKFITIKDIDDFDKLNTGRTIEFHRIFGEKEKFSVIDVDPRSKVPFNTTKKVTKKLTEFFRKKYAHELDNIQVYFSGSRGFHVYLNWKKEEKVNTLKEQLKKDLEEFIEQEKLPHLTLSVPKREDQIRLDISIFHPGGSIRLPYSLHKDTGLAAVPVEDIDKFNVNQAKINNFIKLAFTIIKDEVLETPAIAVDFDKTLWLHKEDDPYSGTINKPLVELLKKLKAFGYDIIIFTARILSNPEDFDFILEVLESNEVPFDEITYKKKPNIEIIIDDKAINPSQLLSPFALFSKLKTRGKPPKGVSKSQFPRITKNYKRYRQFNPSECVPGSFWMKKLKNGDMLVMCKRKDTGKTEVQSKMVRRKDTNAKTKE